MAAVAVAVGGSRARPGRLVAVRPAGPSAAPVNLDAEALRSLGSLPFVTAAPVRVAEALERAGLDAPPIVWDVVELAVLLAPECPTETLQSVASFFGLAETRNAGPAGPESEAQLVAALFAVLVAQLEETDLATVAQVTRLAGPLGWPLRSLFVEIEGRRTRAVLESGEPTASAPAWLAGAAARRRRPAPSSADQRPIDVAEVAGRLAPGGTVARALPGYEPRDEQVRMVSAVADALNNGDRLLVEAGTGTGKTLAYLLPAVVAALQNDWRIVVSTATTTLQDQLFAKDLPALRAGLGEGVPVRVCVLKGRSNYLCVRRWQTLLQATDLEPADRSLLIKTLFWVPRTRTGDRAELRLSAAEETAWLRLCAVTEACTPTRCAYHRLGLCFIARARRAAEESHVVIVNHALLLSDAASRSRVLPDYDVLVVDEAHHLEAEATDQLGWRVGERELTNRLELLWGLASGARGPVGLLPEAVATLSSTAAPDGARSAGDLADMVAAGERAIREAGQLVRSAFDCATDLLADAPVGAATDDGASLRVTAAVRAGQRWQELEGFWQDALACLSQVEQLAAELQSRLEGVPTARDDIRDQASELGSQLDYWRDTRQRLSRAIHTPDAGTIYWLSGQRARSVWLNAAPLDVAELLRERLFDAAHAVVLVSATLAVGGSFAYVKRRLGLEEAVTVALGSPFDFRQAALLYVPNDLPDPTQSGYQASLEAALADIIVGANGRTLVLFTSRAQLRASYTALRRPLAAQGITVLGQGVDGASRTRLLDVFRRGGRVALLGTSSFWEGVDVVGEALSCVVVARLPFAVPTDPIYAARAEQFDDPFGQYAVPQAVLRLKQGFGRLIRSRTDRGAVVVLDRRLVTRAYGSVFVKSLPRCSVKQGPASRAGRVVAEWLASSAQQPPLLAVGG